VSETRVLVKFVGLALAFAALALTGAGQPALGGVCLLWAAGAAYVKLEGEG
jgi:hypothetical protein